MSEDEFTKLFKYLQEFRKENHQEFENIHEEFRRIYGILDSVNKQLETHEQERLFSNHQIDRNTDWIKQLAANTKTKLVPEP